MSARTFRVIVSDDQGNVIFNEETQVDWEPGEHVSRPARRALTKVAEATRLGVL